MIKKQVNLLLELLSLIAVMLGFWLVFMNIHQLPDRIPTHFSFNGTPDATGQREDIWMLPVMGAVIYVVFTMVGPFSRVMKKNEPQSEKVLALVRGMILQLKFILSLVFLELIYGTISIAKGEASGLGTFSTIAFLTVIFLTLTINIILLARNLRKK